MQMLGVPAMVPPFGHLRDVGSAVWEGMGIISGDPGPEAQIVPEAWLDGCD